MGVSAPAVRIGQTPLVRLARFEPRPGVEIHAKVESMNPGGSVKDRAARAIVEDAMRRGEIPRRILLDATSGNTGIAYAMLGAAHGFLVKLCVPANVTAERKRLLRAYGADVVWTDPMDGSDGAIAEARRLFASNPDAFFYADQYNNEANWRAHFETTGLEILEQTDGRVTHFVAGLGTTGTFMGTGRRLQAAGPVSSSSRSNRTRPFTDSKASNTWRRRSCPASMTRAWRRGTRRSPPKTRTP